MFDGPATSIPMIKGGKLKAFAVSGPKRNPACPTLTFAEQGYPMIDEVARMGCCGLPDVPGRPGEDPPGHVKAMAQPAGRHAWRSGHRRGSGAVPDELPSPPRQRTTSRVRTLRFAGHRRGPGA